MLVSCASKAKFAEIFTVQQEFQEFPKFKNLSEIIFRLFYICLWFFILISCLWFSFEVHPVLVKWKSGALCSWTMSDQMAAQLNLWRHYVIMWLCHVTKCKQNPPRPRSWRRNKVPAKPWPDFNLDSLHTEARPLSG